MSGANCLADLLAGFAFEAPAQRVVFGRGTLAQLGDEVRRLGRCRAMVLATPLQARGAHCLAEQLGELGVGAFAGAMLNTPVEVTESALEAVGRAEADCLVAFGGGSTTGLSKAIALRTGLDQVAIPTTYAGAEATPIVGQSESGRKTTLRDRAVLPRTLLYDVELTLTLPPVLSAASGFSAIAHAVEALYAPDGNPATSALAEQGIAALAQSLPNIVADPADLDARASALYGAWACGTCLGTVGMALHHKICQVLTDTFDLPHGETHAIVLPYAVAYNAQAAPEAMTRIARALGGVDPAQALYGLGRRLGLPEGLRAIGMSRAGLDQAASLAVACSYPNPAPLDRTRIRALLDAAWEGGPP